MRLSNDTSYAKQSTTTNLILNLWQKLKTSSLAKTILSGILTLGIVVLLLTQISITDVVNLFFGLAYNWIALAVLLYLVNNVGRAVRLKILLPNQPTRFYKLLLVVNAHTMFNYILPAWTGEFSLLYFLKKYKDIPLGKGSAALIVARIMDYLAVAVFFIIGAGFSLRRLLDTDALLTTTIIKAALVMMLIAVIVLVSMVWWGQRILKLIRWLVNRLGLPPSSPLEFVLAALGKIIDAFAAIHSFRRYALVFLWSLCLWTTIFIRFYALLRGIGIETMLLDTIIGSTFAVLSKAIPFITFSGIGTHEAGWTIGFMLVGFSKTTAISSGFAVNILTLLTTVTMGVCSLWILRFTNIYPSDLTKPKINKVPSPSDSPIHPS